MTPDQFHGACARTRLLALPAEAEFTPERRDNPCELVHLVWMLGQARDFYSAGKIEKANRWLGFVQGVLAGVYGVHLDALKRANMPEGEQFDGERV